MLTIFLHRKLCLECKAREGGIAWPLPPMSRVCEFNWIILRLESRSAPSVLLFSSTILAKGFLLKESLISSHNCAVKQESNGTLHHTCYGIPSRRYFFVMVLISGSYRNFWDI